MLRQTEKEIESETHRLTYSQKDRYSKNPIGHDISDKTYTDEQMR